MNEIFLKTTDNEKIALNHCQTAGDSVLIIAPGWFMTKDTKQFRDITDEFSKYIDVICMDFRGHGRSSGGYTFSARECFDMEAVVNYAYDLYQRVYLLGFSLGGTISILYASKNKVDKIITISAPCDFYKVENRMWNPRAFVPTVKKWVANEKEKIYPRRIRIGNPFLKKIPAAQAVENVQIPHLIIAGEKDPTVFPWHQTILHRYSPDSVLKIYENCYHAEDLYYQAHDRFVEDISAFIMNDSCRIQNSRC